MKRVILLDGDIVAHKACQLAAVQVDWGDGTVHWELNLPQAVAWIKDHLAALRRRLGGGTILVALGDPTRLYFRRGIYPAYKSGRRGKLKSPGYSQLEATMERHLQVLRLPALEGDDVLGILATSPRRAHLDQVVVSIDKDMLQIPGRHYNPDRDTETEVTLEEGDRFHLLQTLTGDRADGYPGCPGVGPKRAAAILDEDGDPWTAVVRAYEKAGLTRAHALQQARVARILRASEYDRAAGKVRLWAPQGE